MGAHSARTCAESSLRRELSFRTPGTRSPDGRACPEEIQAPGPKWTPLRASGQVGSRGQVRGDHDAGLYRVERHSRIGLREVVARRLAGKCQRVRSRWQRGELIRIGWGRARHRLLPGDRLVRIGGRSRAVYVFRCSDIAAVEIDAR